MKIISFFLFFFSIIIIEAQNKTELYIKTYSNLAIEEMKIENPSGDPPIDIETSSKGLIVNIKGDFAFPSGKADMKKELEELLDTEIIPRINAKTSLVFLFI